MENKEYSNKQLFWTPRTKKMVAAIRDKLFSKSEIERIQSQLRQMKPGVLPPHLKDNR